MDRSPRYTHIPVNDGGRCLSASRIANQSKERKESVKTNLHYPIRLLQEIDRSARLAFNQMGMLVHQFVHGGDELVLDFVYEHGEMVEDARENNGK
jgi:hypothetical protein